MTIHTVYYRRRCAQPRWTWHITSNNITTRCGLSLVLGTSLFDTVPTGEIRACRLCAKTLRRKQTFGAPTPPAVPILSGDSG